MTILVVANDVIPGFGVPVAAPGLRAAGLVEGLRGHGHDVEVTVPEAIIDRVWTKPTPPSPPPGATIINPVDLHSFMSAKRFSHVVFTNANMGPHLAPVEGTKFIFDMFAPKILELLASDRPDRDWVVDAQKKERALALADHMLVNGKRKLGYALGWLLRPSVDRIRTEQLGLPRLVAGEPMQHISLVEMPVPLPAGLDVRAAGHRSGSLLRVAMAGYSQVWSGLGGTSPAHEVALRAGHEVHVLAPNHWGGAATAGPPMLPVGVVEQSGPLDYPAFARWLQSMDVVVDVFEQTAERHLAMITRSAVALRLGVPVIHGIDSEISDLVLEYDAGWVVAPADAEGWRRAYDEAADPEVLERKQVGANRISTERFAPTAALAAMAHWMQAK